jgi:DNA polymerase III epsilon subunit-like protein
MTYYDFFNRDILIYDFETNGLLDCKDLQPIEIAIIKISKDGTVTEYNEYVKAKSAISDKITSITGITNIDLESKGITLFTAAKDLSKIFTEDCLIIGHCIIKFDNIILKELLKPFPLKLTRGQVFDTGGEFKATKLGWNGFQGASYFTYHSKALETQRKGLFFNLKEACRYYEIGENTELPFHRAIADVHYTLQVFIEQFKLLQKEKNIPDINHILNQSWKK